MEEDEKQEKQDILKQIEKQISCIVEEGIDMSNLDMLGKLIDIHKDLANEEYWKVKKEVMKDELQKSKNVRR